MDAMPAGLPRAPRFVPWHEAGHAVARLVQDEPRPPAIISVAAFPRLTPEGRWGYCKLHERLQVNFTLPLEMAAPDWGCLDARVKQAAWGAAIEYLAGLAAQHHYLGGAEDVIFRDWPSTPDKAWRDAHKQKAERGVLEDGTAAAFHLWLAGRGLDLHEAWFEAVDLMVAHWPAVDALARVLRRRGEIAGEEVQRIVIEALPRCTGTGGWLGRLV